MRSSSLAERFRKKVENNSGSACDKNNVESALQLSSDVLTELFEKVLSVPYWFEYSFKQQTELAKLFFMNRNFELDSYFQVVGFGIIQPLLDNERVASVIIENNFSVKVVINNNVLDTEIKLNDLQKKYISKFLNSQYSSDYEKYTVEIASAEKIIINKII